MIVFEIIGWVGLGLSWLSVGFTLYQNTFNEKKILMKIWYMIVSVVAWPIILVLALSNLMWGKLKRENEKWKEK